MKRICCLLFAILLCFCFLACELEIEESSADSAVSIEESVAFEDSGESSEYDESFEESSEPFLDVTLDLVNLFGPFGDPDEQDRVNNFFNFILEYYEYESEPLYSIYTDIKKNGYNDGVWLKYTGNSIHVWRSLYMKEDENESKFKIISLGEKDSTKKTVLTFGGDICFADNYATMPYLQGKGGELESVFSSEWIDIMKGSDVATLNCEFAISNRGEPMPHKAYTFLSKPENTKYFNELGVDFVTLANNHVFDFGEDAFFDTLDTLDEYGIGHAGAGRNASEAQKPFYYIINGRKIAYISATRAEKYILTPEATEDGAGVFRCYDNERLLEVIEETKRNCDYVILLVHWGTEYSAKLESVQKRTSHEYIDAGADLIVGTHAHQLQGIEFYEGKAIFYNLGNFWFNAKRIETGLMKLELDASGNEEFYFIPGLQSGCKTQYLLGTNAGRNILDNLASHEPSQITIADDGKITLKEAE